MIPYFRLTTIPLGPIQIQVWGLFVAAGILIATLLGRRESRRRGLDPELFTDFACWTIVYALISARLFYAVAYQPAAYLADPLKLIRVWEGGMSSFGGFIGAAIGAAWFAKRMKMPFMSYANVAAYVLPLGYGIGRIGCFLIHDHPGTLSHTFLSVRYPGGARLDHGLLLSLLGFSIFAVFYFFNRNRFHTKREGRRGSESEFRSDPDSKLLIPNSSGHFLFLFMVLYGAARFFLDFYRAWDLPGIDTRYFLLTPAQYGCLFFIAFGIWGILHWRRTHSEFLFRLVCR